VPAPQAGAVPHAPLHNLPPPPPELLRQAPPIGAVGGWRRAGGASDYPASKLAGASFSARELRNLEEILGT